MDRGADSGPDRAGRACVSLARCAEWTPSGVARAVDEALRGLGGIERFVRPGQRVLLKPNLVSAKPPEAAATTHPWVVERVIQLVQAVGAEPFLGDSPAWGWLPANARACGVAAVAERYQVPLVEFDQPVRVPCPFPQVAASFYVDRRVVEADVILHLPKLKAHGQLGYTAALKSIYGCMPGKRKALWHLRCSRRDSDFARLLVAFHATVAPTLHLVDGIWAMQGAGPVRGQPRFLGILAASPDAAAVDTVLCNLLQAPPSHRLLLEAARSLGFGETEESRIQLLGEPPASFRVEDWEWPPLAGVGFSLPRVVRSVLRNLWLVHRQRRVRGT